MKICRLALIVSVTLIGYVLFNVFPAWVVVGLFVLRIIGKKYTQLSAFGTAKWASFDDVHKAGMFDGNGIILGRYPAPWPRLLPAIANLLDPRVSASTACEQFVASFQRLRPRKDREQPLVKLNAVHTAVFCPTGVGKGVSIVIPTLQTCSDSAVVLDFKGENAQITGDAREAIGQTVRKLDPLNLIGGKDTFNPLDMIDRNSPLALDACRSLANALVVRTGNEPEPHWNDSAEAWIALFIAIVVFHGEPGDRSLQTVRTLLADPVKRALALDLACASEVAGGMLSRLGHQLKEYKDKELNSVLTTVHRHLRFLDSPLIAANTKTSSFDPKELVTGKTTIFLVMPPEHMRAQMGLLRMWISSFLRAVVQSGLQEKKLVRFILDEAASLGRLEAIEDAVDKYRGYGVRLLFLYQSLGQLKTCFPDGEQTLLSNVSQVYFGVNDKETAEYVSARMGAETIKVESGGSNVGGSASGEPNSASRSWGRNNNWAQQKRELLLPEEVSALDPRIAITLTPGIPPLWTRLVRYYEGFQETALQKFWRKTEIVLFSIVLLGLTLALAAKLSAHASKSSSQGIYLKGR